MRAEIKAEVLLTALFLIDCFALGTAKAGGIALRATETEVLLRLSFSSFENSRFQS